MHVWVPCMAQVKFLQLIIAEIVFSIYVGTIDDLGPHWDEIREISDADGFDDQVDEQAMMFMEAFDRTHGIKPMCRCFPQE